MTNKSHKKFRRMKIGNFVGKRSHFGNFPESENLSKIGGNLKQGGKCIMASGGWTPLFSETPSIQSGILVSVLSSSPSSFLVTVQTSLLHISAPVLYTFPSFLLDILASHKTPI